MGRKVKQFSNYDTDRIKTIMDNNKDPELKIRLCVMYQLSKGKSSRELEGLYDVSFKQICNWADRFDSKGIDGLRNKTGTGRKKKLSDTQLSQLGDILLKNPEEFGYDASAWTGPLVQDIIFKQFGVSYKIANVYNIMTRYRNDK